MAASEEPDGPRGLAARLLLNGALLVLGLVVLMLLYAFVTRTFVPRADAVREVNPAQLVGDVIQVEIRNGNGVPGLAERTRDHLRRAGFDVVEVGNYASFDQAHSLVIDRVGNPEAARKVAERLGIDPARIVEELRPELYLDATVVLGHDYRQLTPFTEEE